MEWLQSNKLSLNESKTELIIFWPLAKDIPPTLSIKINKFKLTPCKFVKYLGLLLDENLPWNYQIESISQKLSQTNGILSKLRHYVPLKSCISVYFSIFYSHLIYGCLVWQYTMQQNLNKLFVLQKRCIRLITFSRFDEHSEILFKSLELLKIGDI